MEKNEPALVPEWLRTTSSDNASSLVHNGRHRNSSRNISDSDFPRSAFLDQSSSLNSRRSSSNGFAKHAYSSFSTSRRDKDREREKERLSFGNHWARDSSDPLDILTGRSEKLGGIEIDRFQRSHSMVYGKQGEPLPQRVAVDSKESGNSSHYSGNVSCPGGTVGSSIINKAVFDKDFPMLGTEERQGVPEIATVPSPGFSSASQSLPVGNSALIGGEGWTSALAEVPSVVSSETGSLPTPLTVSTSGSGSPSVTAGLNMTAALAQAPSRVHTSPQLSVKTQRCEELAIKQSRQLIPVTPSMSKGSVLNSVDKLKGKPAIRTSDMNITIKNGQQQYFSTHHGNQSSYNGHVKSDMPKTSGKLLVLKPGWESGVSSPTQKDVTSPTTNTNNKATTSQHAVAVVTSVSGRNSNGERKAATSNPIAGFAVGKKPSLAQTRSRNDFFNLLKKKTSTNSSVGLSDSDSYVSPSTTEKSEDLKEAANASAPACCSENCTAATSNGDPCQDAKRFSDDAEKDISIAAVYPDEEEAAFLRSLGWEENSGEDEGLTEEEINAFYQEYTKLGSSLKLSSGLLPKLSQSFATNLDGASSESGLPGSISKD